MDWNAIGAIGQILGTTAVFATLGYLAVQLRYVRADAQRSVRQSRTEVMSQQMMTLATNERLAGIEARANAAMGATENAFVSALVAQTGLTQDEALSLYWLYTAQWQVRGQMIVHMNDFTPEERAVFDRVFRTYYRVLPASRLWYEIWKTTLPDSSAARYIDALIARPD